MHHSYFYRLSAASDVCKGKEAEKMHLGPGRGIRGLWGARAPSPCGTGLSLVPGEAERGPRAGAVEHGHHQIKLKWRQVLEKQAGEALQQRGQRITLPGSVGRGLGDGGALLWVKAKPWGGPFHAPMLLKSVLGPYRDALGSA